MPRNRVARIACIFCDCAAEGTEIVHVRTTGTQKPNVRYTKQEMRELARRYFTANGALRQVCYKHMSLTLGISSKTIAKIKRIAIELGELDREVAENVDSDFAINSVAAEQTFKHADEVEAHQQELDRQEREIRLNRHMFRRSKYPGMPRGKANLTEVKRPELFQQLEEWLESWTEPATHNSTRRFVVEVKSLSDALDKFNRALEQHDSARISKRCFMRILEQKSPSLLEQNFRAR